MVTDFIKKFYSIAPQRPLIGKLALNENLPGVSKLFEDQLKGPEGLLYHNKTLYATLHYGHVVKLVDNQIIPVVKFGKVCGTYIIIYDFTFNTYCFLFNTLLILLVSKFCFRIILLK